MDYEFGDILDARKAPLLEHFLIVLGERSKKDEPAKKEVMYYIVTSRVYTVFADILRFFNDCIVRKDQNFFKHFSKEKEKSVLSSHGHLIDALFLDKHFYKSCLDADSMIVLNADTHLYDKDAMETLRKDKKVVHRDKLGRTDIFKLIVIVKNSPNISADKKNQISANFNQLIRVLNKHPLKYRKK